MKRFQVLGGCLHIRPLPIRHENGESILAAELTTPYGETRCLWFSVEADQALTQLADPFLIASLFIGLENQWDIHVHGQVSACLLQNLQEFQAIWQSFDPERYQPVHLSADEMVVVGARPTGRIATFSGGVDSAFTAFSNAKRSGNLLPLDAGLMIHGLDIPLDDTIFSSALQSSKQSLATLGINCLHMRTNVRELVGSAWHDVFGTALAACLHVLAPRFGAALIPSSYAYSAQEYRCGSNPLTDPLLGSDALRIIHDGARFTRDEKLAQLAAWPQGLDALRVCWQGLQRDRNCCRCEKCLRTMINIRLLEMPMPASFPESLNAERIAAVKLGATEIRIWQRLIALRKKQGLAPELSAAMRQLVVRMRIRQWRRRVRGWVRRLFQHLDAKK